MGEICACIGVASVAKGYNVGLVSLAETDGDKKLISLKNVTAIFNLFIS